MKKSMSLLLPFLIAAHVQAETLQTKLDVQVEQTLDIAWSKVTKFRHSADCYPFGKGNDYNDLPKEHLKVSKPTAAERLAKMQIVSQARGIQLGETKFETQQSYKIDPDNIAFGIDQIDVSVVNTITTSSYRNQGDSKCVLREYHWRVDSQRIDGEYVVWFQMPKKTWVVSLSISDVVGGAAKFANNLRGDLHGAALDEDSMYLWARPETWVGVPIKMGLYAAPGKLGSFRIQIRRPILPLNATSAGSAIKEFPQKFSMGLSLQATASEFIDFGSRYLFTQDLSKSLTHSLGQSTFRNISDWLFRLANATDTRLGPFERHTKAMAAVIGYELAAEILTGLQQFCHHIEVYLPLTNVTTRVPGFVAAHYWLNRDIRRLDAMQFPEIRAYLEELVRWENNHLRYSDIAKNKSEFQKLRSGFIKLRQHSEFAFDVYGDIQKGVQRTVAAFGNSFATNSLLASALNELQRLGDDRRALNRDFQAEVMKFHLKNEAPIQTSALLHRLMILESETTGLAKDLLGEIKLVSLDPKDSQQTATGLMASQLAHQIGIFDEQLSSPFAEAVRLAFVNKTKTAQLESSFKACLTGEAK